MNKIDGIEFHELAAERYWSFPSGYKKDSKAETRNMIFSGDYLGARKMDGAYYRFVKDMEGNMVLQGRSRGVSGEFLNKIDWVPQLHGFFESLPNGTCLLGELYFPTHEGSSEVTKIMGCKTPKAIERQAKDKLHYYIFDIWAIDGRSLLDVSFEKRVDELDCLRVFSKPNSMLEDKIDYYPEVDFAIYYEGAQLWTELQCVLEEGGEGVVITKKSSHAEPGKRTARKTLKIKKEIANTIDCFFTGAASAPTREYTGKEIETWKFWENLQTKEKLHGEFFREYLEGFPIEPVTKPYFYGWAGSLEIGVVKGNRVVPIGYLSGVSDELKSNPKSLKGKVIEVSCMEILKTGGLRHAKMIQFRDDKPWKECKWEDIFEE